MSWNVTLYRLDLRASKLWLHHSICSSTSMCFPLMQHSNFYPSAWQPRIVSDFAKTSMSYQKFPFPDCWIFLNSTFIHPNKWFLKNIYLFIIIVCVYAHEYTCHSLHMEIRGQFHGVSSPSTFFFNCSFCVYGCNAVLLETRREHRIPWN